MLCSLILAFTLVQEPPADPPSKPDEMPADLLAGPKVDEDGSRVANTGFAPTARGRRGPEVPPRRWLELFDGLDLTETQRSNAEAIVDDLKATAAAFNREHGRELRSLQQVMRQARRDRTDVPREDVTRLQELRQLQPKPAEAQRRLWNLLDEVQQIGFQAKLDEARQRIIERRARRDRAQGRDAMMAETDETPRRDVSDLDDMALRRLRFLLARQRQ
jgi:hypothetical protein